MKSTRTYGKMALVLFPLFIMFILLISNPAVGQKSVIGCTALNNPQTYTLDAGIASSNTCFIDTTDNVVLDCQLLPVIGFGKGVGISIINKTNVTIRNCIFGGFETAILINNSDVILEKNILLNNSRGILAHGASRINTSFNSFLNNSINVENTNGGNSLAVLNNWWGSNVSSDIASTVRGNVVFTPFLNNDPFSDEDNDGVFASDDNCPNDFNPDQVDRDNDGKGDVCDVNLYIRGFTFDPMAEDPGIPSSLLTSVETGYFVVQILPGEDMNVLSSLSPHNAEFFGHIPGQGLLVFANTSKSVIEALSGVRFVDIYQPAYKLEPVIFDRIASGLINSSNSANLEIKVFKNIDQVKQEIINLGGTAEQNLPVNDINYNTTLSVNVTETEIINISFVKDIETIGFFAVPVNELDRSTPRIGVRTAVGGTQFLGLTGTGQVIGFQDSGADTGNVTTLLADIRGRVTGQTNPWSDPAGNGHGTHVVGIAIGNGATTGGTIRGVAPQATAVMAAHRVAGSIQNVLTNALAAGAQIHGNSWGLSAGGVPITNTYHSSDRDIDTFTRNNVGMLVIKSAGNSGSGANTITSPGNSKNILTVGASGNLPVGDPGYGGGGGSAINTIAGFSSRGPTPDTRIKPEVVAPGDPISSLSSQNNAKPDNCNRVADGRNVNYTYCSGTSMAQPHVAGMGALIRQHLNDNLGTATPSGTLVKAFIINGAQDIGTRDIPNNNEGWGQVNLTNSIAPGGLTTRVVFRDNQVLSATGGIQRYDTIRFSAGFPIEITLAWYDLPSAAGAGALINDLDLELINESGEIYRGGTQSFINGESTTNRPKDGVNTVEKIVIKNPHNGFYNISVRAANIRAGTNQPFALVISQVVGVDAANAEGNITQSFVRHLTDPISIVYANGVGLPANTDVNVYVIAHDPDRDFTKPFELTGDNKDVTDRSSLAVATDANGTFTAAQLWDTRNADSGDIQKVNGLHNIVIDLPDGSGNFDGEFTPGVDIVDTAGLPGFIVEIRFCHQVDSDDDLWGGSSRGPTPDLRLKPDVVAPAVGRFVLQSAQSDSKEPENIDKKYVWTNVSDDRYNFDKDNSPPRYRVSYGTSFATPAAASIAALVREFYQRDHNIMSPTAALIKATVINGAEDMPDRQNTGSLDGVTLYSQTGPIPNFREGWGRVNFSKSIMPCGENLCFRFDEESAVKQSEKVDYTFRFSKSTRLEITMAWTDPANSEFTSRSLVNELRLEMISPSGEKYISTFNNFNEDGESVPDTETGTCRELFVDKAATDNENVGEKIPQSASATVPVICNEPEKVKSNAKKLILKEPEDGRWNITVTGDVVVPVDGDDTQKYAIAISGVRGVDATDRSGNANRNFSIGERIFATVVGLPKERAVNVYVIPHDPSFSFDAELDLTGLDVTGDGPLPETSSEIGTLNTGLIWRTTDISTILQHNGQFHLVVDVADESGNLDGKFTPGVDIVDYHDVVGFEVGCTNTERTCGIVESSLGGGEPENFFNKPDTVFANIAVVSLEENKIAKLYVVKFGDLEEGAPLADVTGAPETVTLPKLTPVEDIIAVWPPELRGGDYEIVLDVDDNGIFNAEKDIIDPDGFSVLSAVEHVRFAIDANNVLHATGLQRGRTNKVLYGFTPADKPYSVEDKHPELFELSKDNSITWKVIRENTRVHYGSPDIAVDSEGHPFVIVENRIADFDWLVFFALKNTTGKPRFDFDADAGGNGDPVDVLFYFWDDFWDPNLLNPRMEIDPDTDLPIISTRVDLQYPDAFYFSAIYPSLFIRIEPLFPIHPLVPIFALPTLAGAPAVFFGESLQVATYAASGRRGDGSIKWPIAWSRFEPNTRTQRVYQFARDQEASVTRDISTARPRHGNWHWMPVDQEQGLGAKIGNGDLAIDEDGDIHVAYLAAESFNNKKLHYSILHPVLAASAGSPPQSRVTSWTQPVKISDQVAGSVFAHPAIDVDSEKRAHITWQADDKVLYALVDADLALGGTVNAINIIEKRESEVASLTTANVNARPDIVATASGEPFVLYRDFDTTNLLTLFLAEGTSSSGMSTTFESTEIIKTADYDSDPDIRHSTLEINKYADTFLEEMYVGFTDVIDNDRAFKFKKTLPHLTFLIILDGLDNAAFKDQLDQGKLPNLENLLQDFRSLQAKARTTFPETTFSTTASMMTGLLPKNHKVPGDRFESSGDQDFFADADSINAYFTQQDVKTIFDYLDENGFSSAAVASIVNKGIGTDPPNRVEPISVNFETGSISNSGALIPYLDSLDERDMMDDNDAPHFISVYLLSNDHGLSTNPGDMDYTAADAQLGQIIDKLEEKNALDQSIFIITSDHGFTDVLSDPDQAIMQASNPSKMFDLKVNGKIAHHYATGTGLVARATELEDLSKDSTSTIFNKIEKIYVKDGQTYREFENGQLGATAPVNIRDLFSDASGDIILEAKDAYFAAQPQESIEGSPESNVPVVITGKFFEALINGSEELVQAVSVTDIAKTIAFAVGGEELTDMITVDGKNIFDPEYSVTVGSPVNLHLFDSAGRHVGKLPDGSLEAAIPLSAFNFDNRSKETEITLLQAPDRYQILIEAFDAGTFTLGITKNTANESFSLTFPTLNIVPGSTAVLDRTTSDTFALAFDFDGDGVFESTTPPNVNIKVIEEEDIAGENKVTVLFDARAGQFIDIDLNDEIGVRINGTANTDITGGRIDIARKANDSLDDTGFFAIGETIEVTSPNNVQAQLDNEQLSLRYADALLGFLTESTLNVFRIEGSKTLIPASHDQLANEFSGITQFGLFAIAASDQDPVINAITVTPSITTVALDSITLQVNATDNDQVIETQATFLDSSFNLTFNNATGLFETTLTGPSQDGIFRFVVTALDNSNNTAIATFAKLTLDATPPNVTIVTPQNNQIIKETIVDVDFTVNELLSNSTFRLDAEPLKAAPLTGFTVNTTHGNHTLQIFATDKAGNTGSDTIQFEIPPNNIEISNLDVPAVAKPTDEVEAIFELRNTGNETETVIVQFLEDGIGLENQTVTITPREAQIRKFDYDPILGQHTLTVKAVPVPGETHLIDNEVESLVFVSDKIVALLVDDAFNSSATATYQSALQDAGLDVLTLDTETITPTDRLLEDFRVLIWFTGADEETLSGSERALLQTYLDAGGFLILSGNDIGGDIGDKSFYRTALHAMFTQNVPGLENIAGVPRDPIGRGILADIAESGEEIAPADEFGTTFLNYIGAKAAGIRVDDGNSKVIYFAFGFEDIESNRDRNTLMKRSIEWLDIDVDAPQIVSITPESGIGLLKDTNNVTLQMTTDETAECRLSNEFGVRFRDMSSFDLTNGTEHAVLVTNLENGNANTKFIKCRDRKRNILSFSHDFSVNNRTFLPPILGSIADVTTNENETITIQLNVSDPENDTVTFTVEDLLAINFPRPIASRFEVVNETLRLETTFDDAGEYKVRVVANDTFTTVSTEFLLTINNVNRPPVIQPIPPLNTVEDSFFSFDVVASDPDNDAITFVDNTSLFNINFFTGTIRFTPKQEDVGSHSVNITVSDSALSVSQKVSVVVASSNDPPEVTFVSPQFATADIPFVLSVNASDPEGDTLTFSDNTTLFDISSTGLISFTPSINDTGTHFIAVSVSDGTEETSKILNLVIQAENREPLILNITPSFVAVQNETVNISVVACDPDIDPGCGT